jgi:F420-non-reducing hydrogenase iron-sulfur subunit
VYVYGGGSRRYGQTAVPYYHARRRFAIVKSVFESLGLESDRLKLSWISASEGPKFARVANEYTEEITKLGENPTRKSIFL